MLVLIIFKYSSKLRNGYGKIQVNVKIKIKAEVTAYFKAKFKAKVKTKVKAIVKAKAHDNSKVMVIIGIY